MAMAKDLVCGMAIDTESAITATHNDKTYYFCCTGCKNEFESNPDQYTSESGGCCGHHEHHGHGGHCH